MHTHLKTAHKLNIRKRGQSSTANIDIDSVAVAPTQSQQKTKKITEFFKTSRDDSLASVLARMTAKDGRF